MGIRRWRPLVLACMAAVLILSAGFPAGWGQQQPAGPDDNRTVMILEGEPTEIILSLPADFCGIPWGTSPEDTVLVLVKLSDRPAAAVVLGDEYEAVGDLAALFAGLKPARPARLFFRLDKKTGNLGLESVMLNFAGESTVRNVATLLSDRYGRPSAMDEVRSPGRQQAERQFRWHGQKTSIRFAPSADWLQATVSVSVTRFLEK